MLSLLNKGRIEIFHLLKWNFAIPGLPIYGDPINFISHYKQKIGIFSKALKTRLVKASF